MGRGAALNPCPHGDTAHGREFVGILLSRLLLCPHVTNMLSVLSVL